MSSSAASATNSTKMQVFTSHKYQNGYDAVREIPGSVLVTLVVCAPNTSWRSDWEKHLYIKNPEGVTIGDINKMFADTNAESKTRSMNTKEENGERYIVPRGEDDYERRRLCIPDLEFKPFDSSVLLTDVLGDKRFLKMFFRFTFDKPVNARGEPILATNSNRVDVGFEIHGLTWHETIKQVPTNTTVAVLNSQFENFTGSLVAQFYFDAGKGKTRHLYYNGVKINGYTTISQLLAPGQTKITFNFVWEDKEELIDVQFLIHNSNWTQTIHGVSKNTTVGALNLSFGLLTGTLVPEFRNRGKVRTIYYQGYKVDPDTRVGDLVECDETNVAVHFVWIHPDEQTMLPCDEDNIDAFFREQEFEEAGEQFLHDLDLYYEDQLYTAQDYAERKPSTMTYAMAAQKAAIEKHHKTAAPPPPPETTPAFSMCIPRVYSNINERRIRAIFYNLGYPEIEEIDFVKCEGVNKQTGLPQSYNRVFIHFKTMEISCQTTIIHTSICKILNGEQVKIVYDDPWYWMVSLSKSTRPAKRSAPPRIVLEDPREKMTESQIWNEDQIWSSFFPSW